MKSIDCLLIGHNESETNNYLEEVKMMGLDSGAFKDFNMNFLTIDNIAYSVSDVFNKLNDDKSIFNKSDLSITEPLSAAISYLGSVIHSNGFTFDYINSFQKEKDQLISKLKNIELTSIIIPTTYYVSHSPIIEIIKFVREYNKSARIIIGGPWVSKHLKCLSDEELQVLFDMVNADVYINSAQGESALVKVLDSFKCGKEVNQIPNVFYKHKSVYKQTDFLRENNLLKDNLINWQLFHDKLPEIVNIRTSISCPFSCSFCGFPEHAGKYQTMDIKDIEKSLTELNKSGDVKLVHFIDDTFNFPPNRFKNILKMLKRNKFSFEWFCYFRCQYADEETVKLMKETGCKGVFLGIESGSDTILKNMNKKVSVSQYLQGIELLKMYDIITFGNFIIGFPGETKETIHQTIDFINNSNLDFYRVQLWYCERITPIWKEREKYNIKGDCFNWSHSTMDANEAFEHIRNIFLSINSSVWIPQFNFDFATIWQILLRGYSIDDLKSFLKAFNLGIAEKIIKGSFQEISNECLLNIERSLSRNIKKTELETDDNKLIIDVDFDF